MEMHNHDFGKIRFSKNVTNAAKGIAVLLMLVHHLFSCVPNCQERFGVSTFFIPFDYVMAISKFGKICVAVFVLLSAYGMTIALEKNKGTMKKYILHRLWKLESGFWFVFVIALATNFLRKSHLKVYFKSGFLKGIVNIVVDGLGLAEFFDTPSYNETWWYMSLAILMVFLIPVLVMIYDKVGICLVGAAAMCKYFGFAGNHVSFYLFTMTLGIWLAKGDFLKWIQEKINTNYKRIPLLFADVLVIAGLVIVRYKSGSSSWTDAFSALSIIIFFFIFIDGMKVPSPVLKFIGKHSMNIFLVHTLIFNFYFTNFIYTPKNWILVTALLLITSLAVSIVIETIKSMFAKFMKSRSKTLNSEL